MTEATAKNTCHKYMGLLTNNCIVAIRAATTKAAFLAELAKRKPPLTDAQILELYNAW